MSTTVSVDVGRVVQAQRSLCPALFADLTAAAWTYATTASVFTVTLDADLDAETCARVRDRIMTADAEAEARRAQLRADRDALAPEDPLRRLYDAVLGDS